MTIGTALVIIAILYLIDKHNLWKRAVVVCLITLAVALVGFAGYYGWQRVQEKRARTKAEAELESHWEVVAEEPNWNMLPPPKGYILDSDVSYAILYPLKADRKMKTDAWKWYQDSGCAAMGRSPLQNRVAHERDLFSFDSYDPRWMSAISLPLEAKRALWNAKVAECRLQPGAKNVKACLDRETGTVDVGVEPEKWAQYLVSCGPKQEVIYLNRASTITGSAQ